MPIVLSHPTSTRTLSLFLVCLLTVSLAHEVTFVNECNATIYVGIVPNQGQKLISMGGLRLDAAKNDTISLPFAWSGRFWGRTLCLEWGENCQTGRCGDNWMNCLGEFPAGPVTFVDLRLDNPGSGVDFYDISLVSGYNIPMQIEPVNGTYQDRPGVSNDCTWAGCQNDLNYNCPGDLKYLGSSGQLLGCKAPCDVFQEDQYCCIGAYDTASACQSFSYANTFKQSCRRALSYALDQSLASFTCLGINYTNDTLAKAVSSGSTYVVTLCPNGEGSQWLQSGSSRLWSTVAMSIAVALIGLMQVLV